MGIMSNTSFIAFFCLYGIVMDESGLIHDWAAIIQQDIRIYGKMRETVIPLAHCHPERKTIVFFPE